MLVKEHAMDVWDPSGMFLRFYRVRADTDEASAFSDRSPSSKTSATIVPNIGSPIAIPKSEKGRGCQHALDLLSGSNKVWAETKYDGERAQIHVEVQSDGSSKITIFSKSKRDSTNDRHAIHSVIRSALRLDRCITDENPSRVKHNIILDAEMVAFKEGNIAEFWRIRQLVEDTAYGVRGARRRSCAVPSDEHESMNSLVNEGLSLGLVFFDVLYLDSVSLLSRNYSERRQLLGSLVHIEPGKSMLAKRYPIDMTSNQPVKVLYQIFSEHIAAGEEGLVLKGDDSKYNDYRKPWIKLKRDYLPDSGDKLDLIIVGATWEKVRGRNLRVPPTTFTTFLVGAFVKETGQILSANVKPHFHGYFTVSYGLDREALERLNFVIKSSDPIPYSSAGSDLPFKLSVLTGLKPLPTVILREPLVVDLYGAGFTKAQHSQYYELRFPRLTRFYLPSERTWQDASDMEEVYQIALESVGRDRSDKDISDWVKTMWGKVASPKANCPINRKATVDHWLYKLARLDGNEEQYIGTSTPTRRKRSENDPPNCHRTPVRRKPDDPGLLPLSSKTNANQTPTTFAPSSRSILATPPKHPTTINPWEGNVHLIWLAQPAGVHHHPSFCMIAWKKRIPRERRLHSLDSLLLGCGWATGATSGRQGIILVDECSDNWDKWKTLVLEKVKGMPDRSRSNDVLMISRLRLSVRAFSTSARCTDRAVVYSSNGDPANVLGVLSYPNIPPPHPNSVNIKFLLSPINPADVNVIEGVYPTKPTKTDALAPSGMGSEDHPVFVGGNEGLACVTAVGEGVHSLKVNDWVVMIKQQAGTWVTDRNVAVTDVARVPDSDKLTEVQGATITVNPPTAYNMLNDFVALEAGDWVVQNGANSAVGEAVIQIAAAKGLKTVNLIRDRPNLEELKQRLHAIGATQVLTYDDLADKTIREKLKEWTGGRGIRLGLNCVGGGAATSMARLLGIDAHLVSYGAMAKQPLSLPISLFIFKNLTCHGFWQSRWYIQKPPEARQKMMQELVNLVKDKKLVTPEHEIVTISAQDSDEEATVKLRQVMKALAEGRYGKKVLLKMESKDKPLA